MKCSDPFFIKLHNSNFKKISEIVRILGFARAWDIKAFINIWQCLSVTGFKELNVNHKRDLGVFEPGFWKSCRRHRINLQGCIVGDGTKLSTMPIGSTQVKFSKFCQMAYWHLGKLI